MFATFLQLPLIISPPRQQASYDNLRLEVFLAKLRGAATFILAEKAVEVA